MAKMAFEVISSDGYSAEGAAQLLECTKRGGEILQRSLEASGEPMVHVTFDVTRTITVAG